MLFRRLGRLASLANYSTRGMLSIFGERERPNLSAGCMSNAFRRRDSQKSGTKTVWLYDHADFRKANNLISATDWKGLLCDNVDDSVQRWQENV